VSLVPFPGVGPPVWWKVLRRRFLHSLDHLFGLAKYRADFDGHGFQCVACHRTAQRVKVSQLLPADDDFADDFADDDGEP